MPHWHTAPDTTAPAAVKVDVNNTLDISAPYGSSAAWRQEYTRLNGADVCSTFRALPSGSIYRAGVLGA
ncbi:hypothetical protein Hesp01_73500 [Herbidospora sp. NBRC 101105]|nr:hypothetical protein Hesp01_73500 [Herbidospora sp. NBRC 101105]